jgi:hypothetical protein
MRQLVRLFLLLEAASFAAASLVHGGILLTGYQHAAASTAEGSIAILLLAGFALTWLWPMRTRLLGLAAQTAALLGTLVPLALVHALRLTSPTTWRSWPCWSGDWLSRRACLRATRDR